MVDLVIEELIAKVFGMSWVENSVTFFDYILFWSFTVFPSFAF